MDQEIFSLYKIRRGSSTIFPFSVKDYQAYIVGADRLAHRFGTDLAKAFIADGPGFGATHRSTTTSNKSHTDGVAVAVLSDYVPTATHGLRNHFVACLNRHLIAANAKPILKIDVYNAKHNLEIRSGPQASRTNTYHIDQERLGGRTLLILADIRTSRDHELRVEQSLRDRGVLNTIIFTYFASLEDSGDTVSLSPILSSVANPSMTEVEAIVQVGLFTMNEYFVHFVLGRDYVDFCQFVRRQDDNLTRTLLNYAIGGDFYGKEEFQQNVQFLLWEVEARDSV